MGGFVFYDTETTGIDTTFDQILQFAAIRTDSDLNELDRFEIRCRLLPHVTPSPGAMRVTGVKAAQLIASNLPSHYEMMCKLKDKLLEWSPAIFTGYNSIAFDEHLLRNSFYKTLHAPYLTNTNGNARSDVMRMLQAVSLFYPEALKLPVGSNGKRSFKLDLVAPLNGFNHENAHDALADVEATIFICRLISERAPEVWSSFMRFSQKSAVIDYVQFEPIFCFTDFYYNKPFSFLATYIGTNPDNSSEIYIYDLAVNPDSLIGLNQDQLIHRFGESPKPIRRMRCNASPILMSAEDAPELASSKLLGTDELERRLKVLENNASLRELLIKVFESEKKEYLPSPYVEQQLYEGFFTDVDQLLLDQFHSTAWENRVGVVNQLKDLRLKKLGLHLIYIERPDIMSEELHREYNHKHARHILSESTELPWLTLYKAKQELMELIAGATNEEHEFYSEHLVLLIKRMENAKLIL